MNCTLCELHKHCETNLFPVKFKGHPRLAIFMDYPNVEDDRRGYIGQSDATRLLLWFLRRMSIDLKDVMIDYVLRCHKPKKLLTKKHERRECIDACSTHTLNHLKHLKLIKTAVIMGGISCEAFFNGEQLKTREGAFWNPYKPYSNHLERIYVTYSPAYGIESPSERVRIYRMIFAAALHADLRPKFNPHIPPFDEPK